jgi:hypothetical protein
LKKAQRVNPNMATAQLLAENNGTLEGFGQVMPRYSSFVLCNTLLVVRSGWIPPQQ